MRLCICFVLFIVIVIVVSNLYLRMMIPQPKIQHVSSRNARTMLGLGARAERMGILRWWVARSVDCPGSCEQALGEQKYEHLGGLDAVREELAQVGKRRGVEVCPQ